MNSAMRERTELWDAYHNLQVAIEELVLSAVESEGKREQLALAWSPVWSRIDELVKVCLKQGEVER